MSGAPASSGVYLDWNATTPPHEDVLEAMLRAARDTWGNPSSVHAVGRAARAVVEDAREVIAELCGASPRDVVFTGSATEANNLALRHAPGLVTSRLEHPSVTRVAEALADAGRPVRFVRVPPSGRLDPDDVADAVSDMPKDFVVALMAASHETGVLQALPEVEALVRARGGRLHIDAVQAAGKVSPSVYLYGDSMSLAAHKLRGPKGIGALTLRTSSVPRPVLVGGAQERGIRPGTVDPVAVAGFAVAVRRALAAGPARHAGLAEQRNRLERALAPYGVVNGVDAPRLPHVTSIAFHHWDGEALVAALDLAGVRASSGSACAAGTTEPSPAILAMHDRERSRATVRFSLGEATTPFDVDAAIAAVVRVVTRQLSSA